MHEHQPDDEVRPEPDGPERDEQVQLSPQIWVGSLVDYTNGRLHGDWIEADQEPEALHAAVRGVLAASPWTAETGEPAEEWGIFDYEGFGDLRLGEYEDLALVATLAHGITEHGLAFAAYAELHDADADMLANFEEAYLGHYDSVDDWAREVLLDQALEAELDAAVPDSLRAYITVDYAAFARDCQLSGDIHIEPSTGSGVWIFATR